MELRKSRLALLAFAVATFAASGLRAEGWVAAASTPVSARLVAAVGGTGDLPEIRAGVEVKLAPGWKTYWRSPGDAGLPPSINWKASRNLAAADFDYPTPHRFSVLGIETIGYADHVTFPVKAVPVQLGAPLGLRAELDLLVCADICVPEKFALSLDLPAGDAAPSPHANTVARAFSSVPKDGAALGVNLAGLEAKGDKARALIDAATPLSSPDLFIETEPYLAFSAAKIVALGGGRYELTAQAVDAPKDLDLAGKKLRLTLADGDFGADFTAVATGMAASPPPALPQPPPVAGVLSMLGVALLGGLILNLMPCVLPVLSLKLLSVAQYGGGERTWVRAGFLATAAGIIASFLLLAAATIGFKAAGAAVGWGVQFQQPVFLGFMMTVTTLFAANLAGWFEIPLPRFIADRMDGTDGGGLGGAFITGVFATLLATPCSAPFLGTAVGFALAAGGWEILAIFTALGVGMASPYLLTAVFPAIAGALPRPGRWMLTVRRVMAAAMLGTTVWLASVLAAQLGVLGGGEKGAASEENTAGARWAAFDEAAIAGLVAAGKVVVVDVTADWCVTCQVNKKLVLNRGATAQALAGPKVTAMRADWTKPNDAIAGYLARHGRYGIPFNIVYGPKAPQGVALPELLTESAVLAALAQAGL